MPRPRTIHRFTLIALVVIVLGGLVLFPAFVFSGFCFLSGGGLWLAGVLVAVPVLLLALLLVLVAWLRPR